MLLAHGAYKNTKSADQADAAFACLLSGSAEDSGIVGICLDFSDRLWPKMNLSAHFA